MPPCSQVAGPWLAGLGLLALTSAATIAQTASLPRADGRAMPARLAGDWSEGRCPPTLILSHGLGGRENGLDHLVRAGLREGYRVLVMGHQESGPATLARVMMTRDKPPLLAEAAIWKGRALDLDAAFAHAARSCRPRPLLLGGHSMGAALTMMEAGARGKPPFAGRQRFDGYAALSPQGYGWVFETPSDWARVTAPVLMVTGTRDSGVDGDWTTRLQAFRSVPPGRKRLVVIEGATHLAIGGIGGARAQEATAQAVGEFLRQMRHGWAASGLSGSPGLDIREK